MDLLYLNLSHLVKSANLSFAIQRDIYNHQLDIEHTIVSEPIRTANQSLFETLEQIDAQLVEDLINNKRRRKTSVKQLSNYVLEI